MVVDEVVWNKVSVMVDQTGVQDRSGEDEIHQIALFYADDGMLASLDPGWLLEAFNTLVGLFDRLGLRKHSRKTIAMVCCICQAAGTQSKTVYDRRITGARLSY